MQLRPPRPNEVAALSALLERCFARYPECLAYTSAVVGFFLRDLWSDGACGVVAEDAGLPVAVALGGQRRLRGPRGQHLRTLHIGPVGVDPMVWRRGVGTKLMVALEAQAIERGLDLLSLTTSPDQPAQHLYVERGFGVLERCNLHLRPLQPSAGGGEVKLPPWPPLESAGRPHAIAELGPLPQRVPASLKPRAVTVGQGVALSITWPIISRQGGEERRIRSAQLLALRGEGPDRAAALDQICRQASLDGCEVIWCYPSVARTLPQFRQEGSPWIWRMAKALTPAGAEALAQAQAYDDLGPAS